MSDRLFLATRKGLFIVTRSAAARPTWRITQTAFLGDNVSMVLADPRVRTLYAALNHGHFGTKLHRSRDDGRNWTECATPTYPEKPADVVEDRHPFSGVVIKWALKMIWALETGGPDQPGTLWCGTLPGGLFRSDDGADSWRFIRSLWDQPTRNEWFGGGYDEPGIHSVCVDPRDARCVRVAISCGGVWQTGDGGETWATRSAGMRAIYMPPERQYDPQVQDPHRMVQCAAAPDVLWVQHHGGVFRTTDAGASWQDVPEVRPSVFGFAVAVHPRDPQTAWFAPAIKDEKRIPVGGQVVVSRTRDGGQTFEVLRDGLPQEHAYDLVYRHGLDVDATGQRLALGSTTGHAWISENGGDVWLPLAAHLPPIHAVRFG